MELLTPNCISILYNGGKVDAPTVQVIDIKKIGNNNPTTVTAGSGSGNVPGGERYRFIISDGSYYMQAMLSTSLIDLVVSKEIEITGVVKLKEYICNAVQNRKVIIILSVEILSKQFDKKIGNPINIEAGAGANNNNNNNNNNNVPVPAPAPFSNSNNYNQQQQNQPQQNQPYKPTTTTNNNTTSSNNNNNNSNNAVQRQVPAPAPQQAASGSSSAFNIPGQQDISNSPIHPISSLHPFQNAWVIKARVTNKSEVKRWSNAKGEGRLFSFDLLDADGGDIKVTAFKEQCDKFYPIIELNKVYFVSRGQLKVATKMYTQIKHDYEIVLDQNSIIQQSQEDTKISKINYKFTPIQELATKAKDELVDVIGVVTQIGDMQEISAKATGKTFTNRRVTLVDSTGYSIELTLWGSQAESFASHIGTFPVLAIKGAKINEYGGKNNMSASNGSTVEVNSDHEKSYELRNWYDTVGNAQSFSPISGGGGMGGMGGGGNNGPQSFDIVRKTITQIRDENLGATGIDDFVVKGLIHFTKRETAPWYSSCTKCSRKVNATEGGYYCENCSRKYDTCKNKYMMSFNTCDATGSTWLSSFDEVGVSLLGKTADEMAILKEQNPDEYERTLSVMLFKPFLFKCRAKTEMYQSEPKIKVTCFAVTPIDYLSESKLMIEKIKSINNNQRPTF
jgi:replication factor A1